MEISNGSSYVSSETGIFVNVSVSHSSKEDYSKKSFLFHPVNTLTPSSVMFVVNFFDNLKMFTVLFSGK